MSAETTETAETDFRSQYRASVAAGYSGRVHAGFVFGLGAAVVTFCLIQASGVSLGHWLWVPAGLFLVNLGEYGAHKALGHKKRGFARMFYARHAADHHGFFHHDQYEIRDHRDLRVVLLPSYFLFVVFAMAGILGALLSLVLGAGAGWLLAGGIIAGYVLYEFVHFCDHLPADRAITRLPGLRRMREHHRVHHDPQLATRYNFNVTFPLTDWLLRTTYKPDA